MNHRTAAADRDLIEFFFWASNKLEFNEAHSESSVLNELKTCILLLLLRMIHPFNGPNYTNDFAINAEIDFEFIGNHGF